MKKLILYLSAFILITGCSSSDEEIEVEAEGNAAVEYTQTLGKAPDTARRIAGEVEDKGASYGDEVPMD